MVCLPFFSQILQKENPLYLTNTPKGYEGFILKNLFENNQSLLYIVRDEASLQDFQKYWSFYAPHLPLLSFPPSHTIPYDRISPQRALTAQRAETLFLLAEHQKSSRPSFVVTSPAGLLHKVPPPSFFSGRSFSLKTKASSSFSSLQDFLNKEEYRRVSVVHEVGEYAVRGGIIDLFTTSFPLPLRLDFFGEDLQSIHPFDPLAQLRTGEELKDLTLMPFQEILLKEESVRQFRTHYRALFGADSTQDPLYHAITEQRTYPGYEQWLPLFFENLVNIWDYLKNPLFVLDFQAEESLEATEIAIQDHYEIRLQELKQRTSKKSSVLDTDVYRPLPPKMLYSTKDEVKAILSSCKTLFFSPFQKDLSSKTLDLQGTFYDWASLRTRVKAGLIKDTTLFEEASKIIHRHLQNKKLPLILVGYSTSSLTRLVHILKDHMDFSFQEISSLEENTYLDTHILYGAVLPLEHGFETPYIAFITEQDILGEKLARPLKTKKKAVDQILEELSSFSIGDLLVHTQHGIGKYEGLLTLSIGGAKHDCLELSYDGGDKLFVPVENMEVLTRFGADKDSHLLDKLGSAQWQARKARVKKRLREIAEKLMALAAKRNLETAPSLEISPNIYEEFCSHFPYVETEDQLRVSEEVLEDLSKEIPMDRLVCGDVGFGKTEIALRAAFVAALSGKQVVLVAPTTLLARQHFKTFQERFKHSGMSIVHLSRLVSSKDAKKNRVALETGDAQILISTHAAFGKSLQFKDLGLLIIDEEQHFGVGQKDKLKEKYPSLHILTLTATPIPRTLQMALSGIRDLSLITTPPTDRMAVKTFILPFDGMTIREALLREHFRGGQSFYVAPRVADLAPLKMQLSKLVPELKIEVAHGGLNPVELDTVMSDFYEKKFDVLLSTNIVESGLDVPSANTLILHKADYFGLSQLYQLRGRVGRSKVRGYAYLTYTPQKILSENSKRRLQVLETLDTLGVGFSIASHDMDIRGAGNLVGEEQSGHIKEVGIELYQHMLKEAIEALKLGEKGDFISEDPSSTQISFEGSILIPEEYIKDLSLRLSLYKRSSNLRNDLEIAEFSKELIDRFGTIPLPFQNLLHIIALKRLAEQAGLEKIDITLKGIVLTFYKNIYKNPLGLIDLLNKSKGTLKLRPDHKLFFIKGWTSHSTCLQDLKTLLLTLGELLRSANIL